MPETSTARPHAKPESGITVTFLALRGVQAGREYFVALCPLKLVPRLFAFHDPELPPELRAQRALNTARVPEIARYLVENPSSFVLSALSASVDGDVIFEELHTGGGSAFGQLSMPMESRLLINDGQHRRAAIEAALEERPELGNETVPVILFLDAGLTRSQQMFADLNRYAVKPTRSLGILYDRRDPLARLACDIATTVEPFRDHTEMEKTSLSNRARMVFTLSALYQGVTALLGNPKGTEVSADEAATATRYWTTVGELIRTWGFVKPGFTSAELRGAYVHTHAVALHALGIAGAALIARRPAGWEASMKKLASIDWTRSNPLWEGRAVRNGQITKAGPSVTLTANVIKTRLGLGLTEEEARHEKRLGQEVARAAA